MKIMLLCHDLGMLMHLDSTWTAAGAEVLKRTSTGKPDCILVDLGRRDALTEIARLRALHPEVDIIACAATFESKAVKEANAAGATDFIVRSLVEQRLTRRLKLNG